MNFFNTVGDNIMKIELDKLIDLAIALAVMVAFFLFRSVISYIIIRIFKIKEKNRENIKKNAFYNPLKILIGLFGIYIGILIIGVPEKVLQITEKIFRVALIMLIANGLANLLDPKTKSVKKIQKRLKIDATDDRLNFFYKIAKYIIYIVAILISIISCGYNINGIIAGFGLGGVIVTLAAQDTAKNIFGGLVLIIDKPFIVGDWIQTLTYEGIVEDITFRSTRIRTFDNSLVNIPNAILSNESITNWSKMEKRKYKLDIVLALDTKMETVKNVVSKISFMLINHPNVINEDTFVKFDEIREDGINIMISVFTNSIDYDSYLNAKEHINTNIMEILEHENVKLTHPTQTVYVKK